MEMPVVGEEYIYLNVKVVITGVVMEGFGIAYVDYSDTQGVLHSFMIYSEAWGYLRKVEK